MNAIALRCMAALLLLLAVAGAGYWAGDHNRNNAWLAKQLQAERTATEKYEAEVERGEEAAGTFIAAHQDMRIQFEDLTEKFHALRKRRPLVVPAAGAVCAGAGADTGLAATGADAGLDPGVPVLNAGAVWMWNSALTGTDQPFGACGSADSSEAACAPGAGITLDDAWGNQAINARICAENRLAHQSLINFLKAKP